MNPFHDKSNVVNYSTTIYSNIENLVTLIVIVRVDRNLFPYISLKIRQTHNAIKLNYDLD